MGALRLTAALAPAAAGGALANGDAALAGALPTAPGVLPEAFSSAAPSKISGSSSSADDINNVGISPESEGASDLLEAAVDVELGGEPGEGSVPESSRTPYASKSSSGFIGPFAGVGGGDAVAVDTGGRPPPTCDAVPFNPNGSSTGRSARGSRAGREAASIVFEPDSGDQS